MPYEQRILYLPFVENQKEIESNWSATFGDRKNEMVFIGQDLDKVEITSELEACLLTEEELNTGRWKEGYADEWPVARTYALNH
jgi:hypothetical protein